MSIATTVLKAHHQEVKSRLEQAQRAVANSESRLAAEKATVARYQEELAQYDRAIEMLSEGDPDE